MKVAQFDIQFQQSSAAIDLMGGDTFNFSFFQSSFVNSKVKELL